MPWNLATSTELVSSGVSSRVQASQVAQCLRLFMGHEVSVTSTQLHHCPLKTARDDT